MFHAQSGRGATGPSGAATIVLARFLEISRGRAIGDMPSTRRCSGREPASACAGTLTVDDRGPSRELAERIVQLAWLDLPLDDRELLESIGASQRAVTSAALGTVVEGLLRSAGSPCLLPGRRHRSGSGA